MKLRVSAIRFWLLAGLPILGLLLYKIVTIHNNPNFSHGIFTKSQALIALYGPSDMGSYLKLAHDLVQFKVSNEHIWILQLWPPGQPILESFCLLIFGDFFFLGYTLVTFAIWVLPSIIFFEILRRSGSTLKKILSATAAFLWLFNPISLEYNTSTIGTFASDPQGLALLALTASLTLFARDLSKSKSQNRIFVFAGISLGVALHFRWAFIGLVLGVVVLFIAAFIYKYVKNTHYGDRATWNIRNYEFRAQTHGVVALFLTVLPWTFICLFILHPGNPSWAMADYVWAQAWLSDADLVSQGGQWAVDGGINWAHHVAELQTSNELRTLATKNDPTTYSLLRAKAIELVYSNSWKFITIRMNLLPNFWFKSMGSSASENSSIFLGMAAIGFMGFQLIFSIFRSNIQVWKSTFFMFTCYALLISILLLTHWEGRYLLPIFVASFFGLIHIVWPTKTLDK